MEVRVVFLPDCPLVCLYINIGVWGAFLNPKKKKKMKNQNRKSPLNSSVCVYIYLYIYIYIYIYILVENYYLIKKFN